MTALHGFEAKDVSKKHNVDEIEDLDDSAYELLGNKFSRLAKEGHGKDRFRERRAIDRQDYYAPSPKVKRSREKL
jgi:hypothetical protein